MNYAYSSFINETIAETMLVRMWQNIKFTSFLCRRKIYISSHLLLYQVVYFFYIKVKIYTSSLLFCYQLPIFFNESTYL